MTALGDTEAEMGSDQCAIRLFSISSVLCLLFRALLSNRGRNT